MSLYPFLRLRLNNITEHKEIWTASCKFTPEFPIVMFHDIVSPLMSKTETVKEKCLNYHNMFTKKKMVNKLTDSHLSFPIFIIVVVIHFN